MNSSARSTKNGAGLQFLPYKVNNPEVTFQDFIDEIETNEKAVNMTDDEKIA